MKLPTPNISEDDFKKALYNNVPDEIKQIKRNRFLLATVCVIIIAALSFVLLVLYFRNY